MKNLKSIVAGLALVAGILIVPVLLAHAQTAAPAPAAPAPAAPAPAVAKGDVVNVNTADIKQLELIKGIGPKLAKKIIDKRTKDGNFKAIDDLKVVVGEKLLAKIKDKLVLEGETTMKPAEKAAPKSKKAAKKEPAPKKEKAPKAEAPAAPAPAPAPAAPAAPAPAPAAPKK